MIMAQAPAPTVTVNQTKCEFRSVRPDGDGVVLATYDVPASALPGSQPNTIGVTAAGETPVKAYGLEMRIAPAQ